MSLFIIDHDSNPITITDQDNIVSKLASIELDKDIVIVYMNEYINLNKIYGYCIKNISSLLLHQKKYIIPVVLFLPIGYKPHFESLIPGVKITQVSYASVQEGFEIEESYNIDDNNEIVFESTPPDYIIYKGITIHFDVFDRARLVSEGKKKVTGDVVQSNSDIFSMNIRRNYIGIENDIRNVYFIKSHYLYNRVPDF